MHSAIKTQHRPEWSQQSYHSGKPHRLPVATIEEIEKRYLSIVLLGRHNKQRNDDGEDTYDMNHQNEYFQDGQTPRSECVEDYSNRHCGDDEQCPVPPLRHVAAVIESDQALNDGARCERKACYRALPSCRKYPSYRSFNRILGSMGWVHKPVI